MSHRMMGGRKAEPAQSGFFSMLFDDIANAPVADPSSTSDWNDFFQTGAAITAANVIGNEVTITCVPGQSHPIGSSSWQNFSHLIEFIDTDVFSSFGTNAFDNSSIEYFESGTLESFSFAMFSSCSNLLEARADNLVTMDGRPLINTTVLERAVYPNCIFLSENAFRLTSPNTNPLEISFPSLETTSIQCFQGRRGLTGVVNFPELTAIAQEFLRDTRITICNAPKATSIGSRSFFSVSTLLECNALLVESIGLSALEGTTNLSKCDYPNCVTVATRAFTNLANNNNLQVVNLPSCITISGGTTFNRRTGIETLTLNSLETCGATTGDNNVFNQITGNTIEITIPDTAIRDDGDIQYLVNNNTVTFIDP